MSKYANKPLSIGAVVIGRNEGQRLENCLDSVTTHVSSAVYVDSGSTDNSQNLALQRGVELVELDVSVPFTAARARNAGFKRLIDIYPNLQYVFFVDGDCEVVPTWVDNAVLFLHDNPDIAVVCGRRRERNQDYSVYNLLCDIEWDTPPGETDSCGGDSIMRVDAFSAVNGFRSDLIAGEEPELCVRLRQTGWRIWRLDADMTIHDANISNLGQWWKRSMRSGYAFAEGSYLHGKSKLRFRIRDNLRIAFWGLGVPTLTCTLLFFSFWGFTLLLIYPLQVLRIAFRGGLSGRENLMYALFLMFGKFPEAFGQIKFVFNKLIGRRGLLIEYK